MRTLLPLAALVLLSAPTLAADLGRPSPVPYAAPAARSFLSEVRIGASVQDPSGPESGSVNVTGEVLFAKPFTVADPIVDAFIPRVHVGGSLNFSGDTSFAYAGFTWTFDVWQGVFVEGSFGGAIHNGNTQAIDFNPDEAALGCSPLFRESASIGYRFTPQWSLMATVEHLSNAGLCKQNRGLTNFGLRLGYSF